MRWWWWCWWRCWWWCWWCPCRRGVEPPGGDSGSGSPLRSPPAAACWLPFYVFLIYAAASSRYTSGESYIVRFRSRRVGGTKIEAKRTSEGQKSPGGAPKGDGRASPSLSLFPAPFASFKDSMSSVSEFLKRGLWVCSIPSPVAPGKSKILKKRSFL